jgi:anti-sigma-K factor RskA
MQGDVAFPPAHLESVLLAAIPRSRVERAREIVSHPKFWRGAAVGAAAATVAAFGLIVARRVGRPELVG